MEHQSDGRGILLRQSLDKPCRVASKEIPLATSQSESYFNKSETPVSSSTREASASIATEVPEYVLRAIYPERYVGGPDHPSASSSRSSPVPSTLHKPQP